MRSVWILNQLAVWVLCSLFAAGAEGGGGESAVEPKPASSRQEIYRRQREEKLSRLEPTRVSRWEKLILAYEKRPLLEKLTVKGFRGVRLALGGMPSGSGFVFGASSIHGRNHEKFTFTTRALYSTRGYSLLETTAELPRLDRNQALTAYASARYSDFTSQRFFGIGPDSSSQEETSYRLESRRVGAGVSYRPLAFLEVGTEVALLGVSPGPGSREPSLESILDPGEVPGLFQRREFLVSKSRAAFRFFDGGYPRGGVSALLEFERYAGRGAEGGSFSRFSAEVQGQIPLGTRSRRLAFRARTTHGAPDAGEEIPFYLLDTIGGATTLRGFAEDRFRDRHTLLMNLEYRWEVWSYADFALFSDAGKVFDRLADLGLSRLKSSLGFGVRFHTPGGLQLRIDVARSNEGFRVHVGAGPRF